MLLLYAQSFYQQQTNGKAKKGQISVSEEQGRYRVIWQELLENGDVQQEVYYEDTDLYKVQLQIKIKIAHKLMEGYRYTLSDTAISDLANPEAISFHDAVDYYSELHSDQQTYQQLSHWRRMRAREEGISPFLIASNRLLRRISAFFPFTLAEWLQIPGCGKRKWEKYGEDIIRILKARRLREDKTEFNIQKLTSQIDPEQFWQWDVLRKLKHWRENHTEHVQNQQILSLIQRGDSLNTISDMTGLDENMLLRRIEVLEQEGYEIKSWIKLQLEQMSEQEMKDILHAFEQKGEQYLKPIMEAVYRVEQQNKEGQSALYTRLKLVRLLLRLERVQKTVSS